MKRKLEVQCRWIARRHGGLAIGLSLHFPCVMHLLNGEARNLVTLSLSLLAIRINLDCYGPVLFHHANKDECIRLSDQGFKSGEDEPHQP